MSTNSSIRTVRLSIDVEPELRKQIKVAATQCDQSIREFVLESVVRQLAVLRSRGANDRAWSQLSAPSFARDWESDEDAVYDDAS